METHAEVLKNLSNMQEIESRMDDFYRGVEVNYPDTEVKATGSTFPTSLSAVSGSPEGEGRPQAKICDIQLISVCSENTAIPACLSTPAEGGNWKHQSRKRQDRNNGYRHVILERYRE